MNDTRKYDGLLGMLDAIVSDLKRMIDIPVIPDAMGNCAVPIAVYCFTSMDCLGALFQNPDKPRPAAYQCVTDFVEIAFDEEDKLALEGKLSLPYLHHGYTRTFMPRHRRLGTGRQAGELFYFFDDSSDPALDADELALMVIRAIQNFDEMLRQDTALLVRAWLNFTAMRDQGPDETSHTAN